VSALLIALVGALVLVAGFVTVTRTNPIHAVLSMLVALAGVAALMLGLRSPFLAAMQILLYGGAIMVLFLFVIMLLSLREDEMGPEPPTRARVLAAIAAFTVLAVPLFAISRRGAPHHFGPVRLGDAFGSAEHFARFLYTDYVVAFELITVLVMAAAAGVIVLARRPDRETLEGTRLTQNHGRSSERQEGTS
jgi:NADH-quinone oxidoreductase subunit J